jgi:hypothetical protein
MSRSRIIALTAVIAFIFGMIAIDNVLAGEKYKGRTVKYCTKWEQLDVGDIEGHFIGVYEDGAILNNMEGKPFFDGWVERECGIVDVDPKTGAGVVQCYGEVTEQKGDKIFWSGEGELKEGLWEVDWTLIKGTGGFEGIQGKGHFTAHTPTPTQWYSDWEMEVELPK